MSNNIQFNDFEKNINYSIIAGNLKEKVDYCYKLILIGESSVGKTCLTTQGINGIFKENSKPTIGIEYFTFNIKLENKNVQLKIFDTCGTEKYKSIINNFYRGTSLAIIVYAIDE